MTSPLIIIKPVTITPAMLIATDVPEADYAAWSGATTYALGDRVILASTHKVYESASAGNLNKNPPDFPDLWIEVSPTNRWKLFDTSNSTQTAQGLAMSYTLRPGQSISALAALNVVGAIDVRVRLVHPTMGTLYDQTTDLTSLPTSSDYWEWCFGERTAPPLMIATDLPGVLGCDVIVDFTGTTALAVGVLLIGDQKQLGISVQQGARVGIQDYSRKETNQFGDTVLAQRAFAKRASFDLPVLAGNVDEVVDFLTSLRAIPCLWIGSRRYNSTIIFGFFKEFDVNIAYASVSECSLSIEGMT